MPVFGSPYDFFIFRHKTNIITFYHIFITFIIIKAAQSHFLLLIICVLYALWEAFLRFRGDKKMSSSVYACLT